MIQVIDQAASAKLFKADGNSFDAGIPRRHSLIVAEHRISSALLGLVQAFVRLFDYRIQVLKAAGNRNTKARRYFSACFLWLQCFDGGTHLLGNSA